MENLESTSCGHGIFGMRCLFLSTPCTGGTVGSNRPYGMKVPSIRVQTLLLDG